MTPAIAMPRRPAGALKLGTRISLQGRVGTVVARTLSRVPLYDVRFPDGTVRICLRAAELDGVAPPAGA